ncbi:MAG TPA: dienelactone hydrolase family protein [Actinocrinis sp.]|nr:dienelactone hydrolase family protein [Actinocrinis sp.]
MPTTMLHIPTTDGKADAFAAFPDDDLRHPGVLLYMDAFGLRPELEDKARELAGHGYYVLVPNLYYRYGPAPLIELPEYITLESRPEIITRLLPQIMSQTPELVLRDAGAFLEFLTARDEVGEGPVATVGYCMGASHALLAAAAHPGEVAAVAGFHPDPMVTRDPEGLCRSLAGLTAEVHLGIAEGDMTDVHLDEVGGALDAAGFTVTAEIYPDTVHGFTMADTESLNPLALQRHWDRLLPLLDRALTGR